MAWLFCYHGCDGPPFRHGPSRKMQKLPLSVWGMMVRIKKSDRDKKSYVVSEKYGFNRSRALRLHYRSVRYVWLRDKKWNRIRLVSMVRGQQSWLLVLGTDEVMLVTWTVMTFLLHPLTPPQNNLIMFYFIWLSYLGPASEVLGISVSNKIL